MAFASISFNLRRVLNPVSNPFPLSETPSYHHDRPNTGDRRGERGQEVQGFPGGSSSNTQYGGGGGGAGGAGQGFPIVPSEYSYGGIGRAAFSDDAGIPPAYGTPGPTPGRYFAGGGGGGTIVIGRLGGDGGGGTGGDRSPTNVQTSTAGTVNTGGGGGGGSGEDPANTYKGRAGGPGIIIIRYIPI